MDIMNKVVITGGTGSLGNHLVDYLLSDGDFIGSTDSEVRIVSRDEEKQWRMRNRLGAHEKVKFYIGDVRDRESLKRPFDGVDVVIHAAALKQVDTCEYFPQEVIKTNVLGAENVCAVAEGTVPRCVAISTDKAVRPVNAYGMSKGLQERIFTNWPNGKTSYCVVRYGNVIGSRGSVIPLFVSLAKEGRTLPITDASMTRFWLKLDDAIGIIKTSELANHGEVLIPRMRSSLVTDVAEIIFDHHSPDKSIDAWKEIGVRPGEKIHEDIISPEEGIRTLVDKTFYRIQPVGMKMENPEIDFLTSNNAHRIPRQELVDLLASEGWLD